MIDGSVHTVDVKPFDIDEDKRQVLRDVVEKVKADRKERGLPQKVEEHFYLDDSNEDEENKWIDLKGKKDKSRIHRASGFEYKYSEGAIDYPDRLDKPSRTILTGEGGSTPSRFKHVIWDGDRKRRLIPEELELLNGFPIGHTKLPPYLPVITDGKRAFLMGNALVVGIVEKIGAELEKRMNAPKKRKATVEGSSRSATPGELVDTPAD